ncbi:MAG: MFS transporter [Bacteroidia bacterium]|nr:MFS transporter [Bacteroidia bacterium]
MIEKNNPKIIKAWCFYDWANSVYSLSITTAIFPAYYSASVKAAFGSELVRFFGWQVRDSVIYSLALSFSFLVVVFVSPVLSGIADYGSRKKTFMKFFAYLGSLSCVLLYFFTGKNIEYGIILSVLASIGFAGSLVFYNSYLPDIATEDRYDAVSARGFSLGYIGSVILLVLNLVNITYFDSFGFAEKSDAVRFTFITVGLWWFGFSQYTFHYLPDSVYFEKKKTSGLFRHGFLELKKVFIQVKSLPQTRRFLLSFFFYIMATITVIYLAGLFASEELGMETNKLIMVILFLQLLAIAGAQFFAWVSKHIGNVYSLIIMIIVWVGICIGAYYTRTDFQFYILALVVGTVMGGIQSLSRSTYSKLIPEGTTDTASFFSFYDVTEKLATVFGTLSFGLINHFTGSMRTSALALGIFFIAGLIVILPLRKDSKISYSR